MGYIELTDKQPVNVRENTLVIRILGSTLLSLRESFPAKENETASAYFQRLSFYLKGVKGK